ncbi:MAG: sel1 repeat family protein [Alphaproteobacteria bacterium]|nr:sel1 repeat family protein [Alphaproteobacteria bacterium]
MILADFYYKGIGTNPNKTESNKWFTISFYRDSERENSEIVEVLLSKYEVTEGVKIFSIVPRVRDEHIQGYWGHYIVGKHLLYGTNGYPQDKVAACYWLEKASQKDLPHADYLLYQMLKETKMESIAYRHLIASAEMRYAPAMKEAAIILLEEKNYKEAYRLLKLAEKEGGNVEKYLQQTYPNLTTKELHFLNRAVYSHPNKFLNFKKKTSVTKYENYKCLSIN